MTLHFESRVITKLTTLPENSDVSLIRCFEFKSNNYWKLNYKQIGGTVFGSSHIQACIAKIQCSCYGKRQNHEHRIFVVHD